MKRININTIVVTALLVLATAGIVLGTDEITASGTLSVEKNYLSISRSVQALSITMTGQNASYNAQAVPGAWTAVTIGSDVTAEGWAFFRNTDTNLDQYVLVGPSNNIPMVRLEAGEFGLMRLATNTIFAISLHTNGTEVVTNVLESTIISR